MTKQLNFVAAISLGNATLFFNLLHINGSSDAVEFMVYINL